MPDPSADPTAPSAADRASGAALPWIAPLPFLGTGLSLSFGVEPDPVALAGQPGGPAFIEYAGAVQVDHVQDAVGRLHALGVPVLYHPSCLNLCGPWGNPTPWLQAVAAHCDTVQSAWLAQDVAVCFVGEEPGYSIDLGWFVPPVLDEEGLRQAIERVREVRAVVDRPLLLEPAPVTFQVGPMHIFEWLGRLARETDCGLLLDAGHVVSHQLARGSADLLDGIDALDLDRVIEVHVAGGVIRDLPGGARAYVDAHDLPVLPETWQVLTALVARCPELRAVCVECEGAVARSILPLLRRVREQIALTAASEGLRARARQELSA
ncbi:MAG: DUF692 family protein [Alphaproteobacteria bacterium]|nr:DUF692 family protein [Alphaproteobacteria bacterium]